MYALIYDEHDLSKPKKRSYRFTTAGNHVFNVRLTTYFS